MGERINMIAATFCKGGRILGSFLEREQNKWKPGSSEKGTCVVPLRYEGPGKWLSLQFSLFLVY